MPDGNNGLYEEKLKRYTTAMDVGKPDKVPIRLNPSEFVAKYAGLTHQEIYYEQDKNMGSVNKFLDDFDIDALLAPPSLCMMQLARFTTAFQAGSWKKTVNSSTLKANT